MRDQRGSLTKKNGAWIFRWRVIRSSDGARVEHTKTIARAKDMSEREAREEVNKMQLLSSEPTDQRVVSFKHLADHYAKHELDPSALSIRPKARETIAKDEHYLHTYIMGKWGKVNVDKMAALDIERWFIELNTTPQSSKAKGSKPLSWPTISIIRNLMSSIFNHGLRHDLVRKNVMENVRCRTVSDYKPKVLRPTDVFRILGVLDTPATRMEFTAVLLIAVTGLRAHEAFGLLWSDIDWDGGMIHLRRGWSKGAETKGKTKGSLTQVAMSEGLAEQLKLWRSESTYAADSDWLFASERSKGKEPRSASTAGQDYLRKTAVELGLISKEDRSRFGFHTLRHSLSTHLVANNVDPGTVKSMLRHANVSTTMNHYAHGVSEVQVKAQEMYLAALKPASPAVN
jgi:integrase